MTNNPYDELDTTADNDARTTANDPFADVDEWETDGAFSQPPYDASPTAEVIDADNYDDILEESDFDADFDDYTPLPTRFQAPRAEDVLVDNGKFTTASSVSKADRKAQKAEEKLARRQAQEERKRNRQVERSQKKQSKTPIGILAVTFSVVATSSVVALILFSGTELPGKFTSASQQTGTPPVTPNQTTTVSKKENFMELTTKMCESSGGKTGAGNANTPENAILAFNHAYYLDKSAKEAIKYLDTSMYDSETSLQEGIDQKSNGNNYCLNIKPGDKDNLFDVVLTEYLDTDTLDTKPETRETNQSITMEKVNGNWKIKTIVVDQRTCFIP